MGFLTDWLTDWLKGLLIEGIMGNLTGLFDTVNTRVGEIAVQVGTTPAAWNAGVFSLIRQLSETVILPIAGLVLTFVATYELIQLIIEKNNLHDLDYWIFFKWMRIVRNKAQYSLDCEDGIEYSACVSEPTPQELLERMELSNQQGDQQGRLQKYAGAYQVEPYHRQENPHLAGILWRCN